MRRATLQGHYDALFALLWLACRLAHCKTWPADARRLDPPEHLFRLAVTSEKSSLSGDGSDYAETSGGATEVKLRVFLLLLRAHAESMPRNDPVIEGWAIQLLACQNNNDMDRAFAQWVLDWSRSDRGKDSSGRDFRYYHGGREDREEPSCSMSAMAMKLNEIFADTVPCGKTVLPFEQELTTQIERISGI